MRKAGIVVTIVLLHSLVAVASRAAEPTDTGPVERRSFVEASEEAAAAELLAVESRARGPFRPDFSFDLSPSPAEPEPEAAIPAQPPSKGRTSSGGSDARPGHEPNYFAVRLGPLMFSDDDLDDLLGTAFYSEIVFGYNLTRHFAVEVGGGYYYANGSEGDLEATLWGIPALLQAKLTAPLGPIELFVGGGVGMYFLKGRVETDTERDTDDAFAFGGNVSGGVHVPFPGGGYVGVEAKLTQTGDTSILGEDISLDGVSVLFVSGIRF